MSSKDYITALKQGKQCYQSALIRGEYPYLPALDDILSYTEIVSTVDLGLIDIPLHKVVGTKTAGRSNAFANNFMPLLPDDSEFGMKWISLYKHQVEDGIQDPIVAYEFMNKFYVQEGNKRVSVMKHLETSSITGTVIRLVPKKTDDKENRLYYEFLDFYQVAQNYDVWFSKEGSYKKLLKLMGKKDGEEWNEEERLLFHSCYIRFAKAFRAAQKEKQKLELTISDAFLVYIEIYGYDKMKEETDREIFQVLQKTWNEIRLADKGSQVELVQNPEKTKSSLLNRLIPTGTLTLIPETIKIAFIHTKTKDTSSWTYAHELGRLHLEQVMEGKVKTLAIDHADTDAEVEAAIEFAISEGYYLIFTTAIQMVNQSVRSAIRHPKVKIFNCSIKMSYTSICTYSARMYESKFLLGAISAALSRTNRLGYVADYPIYGTIANINAFALGARMINPYVEIYLEWSKSKGQNAKEQLIKEGIIFISDHDMITPNIASREYGLYSIHEKGPLENLATPIWHWGKFYEQIIKNLTQGNSEANAQKGKKAVNYWWGMSAGVIDVICSKNIPHGTHRLIEFLKTSICAGTFHPFDGLIYSQNGIVRCEKGSSLNAEEIITMDWLAENVIGEIPEFEELTEEAQMLVQLQGIKIDETANTDK